MASEPQAPNYFLDSFPRDEFPQYVWDPRPAALPADAWTTETTHRDGQQGGIPLTTESSLTIYDILCRFTGQSGAIRQAEFFVYRPSDRAALEGALERYKESLLYSFLSSGGACSAPTTRHTRSTAQKRAVPMLREPPAAFSRRETAPRAYRRASSCPASRRWMAPASPLPCSAFITLPIRNLISLSSPAR